MHRYFLSTMAYSLGIDIGSTTIKMALVEIVGNKSLTGDERSSGLGVRVLSTDYHRHNADPVGVGRQMLSALISALPYDATSLSVAITGSVGMGYADRLGVDFEQEVIAAAEVVKQLYPQTKTLVDIGGEDSKMIFFSEGRVPDMRMNGNCAGGTGAFIDQTATLLGVETAELNSLAEQATSIWPIASRCGVFSKTDIQNLISRSVSKADIAASMLNAVSIQVVSALARGTDIEPQVFFCGGPFAYIPELRKHILKAMAISEDDCIVPEHTQFIPAIGTALRAKTSLSLEQVRKLFDNHTHSKNNTLTNILPPLFDSESEYHIWLKAKQHKFNVPTADMKNQAPDQQYFLGVDSGSTTTKIVLLNKQAELVWSSYSYNHGNSFKAFTLALEHMHEELGEIEISSACTTGYGENLLKTAFNLNYGIVETMAHFIAARHLEPQVSCVLDIGGQDMKAIFVDNGSIRRIEINEACSSGCGSFIMTFATQLGYDVAEFARMATLAQHPYDLGTRCTVFMNSKVKQAMREGAAIDDIAAGFSYSVIKNCLYKVLKLQSVDELGKHIMVQGGTFRNHSVVRALEKLTGCDVAFSNIPELMGAYGAALYALENRHL